MPGQFFQQSENNRQASGGPVGTRTQQLASNVYLDTIDTARNAYRELLAMGISKEQARGILPTCMYVSFIWTCSLQALLHFISLRRGEGAQSEIRAYADALLQLGRPVAPEAFQAFENNNYDF